MDRFLKPLRQHHTVFPTESLILIFSNIEKIFRFQQKFLEALRYGIDHNKIAEKFLEYVSTNKSTRNDKLHRRAMPSILHMCQPTAEYNVLTINTLNNNIYEFLSYTSNLTLWFIQHIAIHIHAHSWNSKRTLAIWKRWRYWKSKYRITVARCAIFI